MEFWGVEVKAGASVTMDKMEIFGSKIHLSQIALGEAKKGKSSEPVVLFLKTGGQKLVLGTLIRDSIPQISFDLYLDSEFELSHTSKDASVYFTGYREDDGDFEEGSDDFDESDDDLPLIGKENGKPEAETKAEKEKVVESKKDVAATSVKQVKIVDPKKDEEDDSDDDSDDEDEDDSADENEARSPDEMDADNDSDDESESEEETPTPVKKVVQGKKRPNESASKTPVSNKKAKNATPEKTDGKKNAHTATPHPFKKGGKSPNSVVKGKNFNSGGQNKKAKYGAK